VCLLLDTLLPLANPCSADILLHTPHMKVEDEACPSLKRVLAACHSIAGSIYPIANGQFDMGQIDPFCSVSVLCSSIILRVKQTGADPMDITCKRARVNHAFTLGCGRHCHCVQDEVGFTDLRSYSGSFGTKGSPCGYVRCHILLRSIHLINRDIAVRHWQHLQNDMKTQLAPLFLDVTDSTLSEV
jgi:hypothetical protein